MFPKYTKQLLANFEHVPNNIITVIVDANVTRKKHIADQIIKDQPEVVGIYRLTMKIGSDNFRQSAIQDIIEHVKESGTTVVIYKPVLEDTQFDGLEVVNDLATFLKK